MKTGIWLLVLSAFIGPQDLTEKTYRDIRESLLLESNESHWKQIPWRPDLGVAIVRSSE